MFIVVPSSAVMPLDTNFRIYASIFSALPHHGMKAELQHGVFDHPLLPHHGMKAELQHGVFDHPFSPHHGMNLDHIPHQNRPDAGKIINSGPGCCVIADSTCGSICGQTRRALSNPVGPYGSEFRKRSAEQRCPNPTYRARRGWAKGSVIAPARQF